MSKKVVLVGDLGTDHSGFPPTPVIAGSPNVLIDGKPVARVGDPLAPHSKPKHPPHSRAIATGSSTVLINGLPAAVTGGAVSCGGVTIGSGSVVIGDTYTPAPFSGISPAPSKPASQAEASYARSVDGGATESPQVSQANGLARGESSVVAGGPVAAGMSDQGPKDQIQETTEEPGFHVVRQPMSKNELLALLYGDASAKPDNFERLNPNLGNRVLPGEMIVIADPNSFECTAKENDLMQVAENVNREVRDLSEEEAQFVVNHYDLLEAMTSSAATGLGVGATMIGQQIKSISATLKELESLYQDTFSRHGTLNNAAFFERRKQLFAKLDFALGKLARKGMSLDDNARLKRALGLSSKSIVHEWKASGIGDIPGYGTHYRKAADAARFIESGGRLVIALDVGLTGHKIYKACSVGREEYCEEVSLTETGRLAGSVAGGAVGAYLAPLVCTAVGIGTGGIGGVACSIVAAGAGAFFGGQEVGDAGAEMGRKLYEVRNSD